MGKSKKDENGEAVSSSRINVHEARIRKILQVLKERNATITIDRDLHGNPKTTTYGEGKHADHKLKQLFLPVWEDATVYTYYEYLKKILGSIERRPSRINTTHSMREILLELRVTLKSHRELNRKWRNNSCSGMG